ncbi:hypothetical protein [Spelaeicoccus albus]|nr:hypothetical protein [Spelaeicoccus albus]
MRRAVRGVWPHLPVLLIGSIAVCAGAAIATLIAPGLTPVSVLVIALLVIPPFAALIAVANGIVVRGDATVRQWGGSLIRSGWRAVTVAVPPVVALALLLTAVEVWRISGQSWVLVPLGVAATVSAIGVLGLTAALPLALERPGLRGTALWLSALFLVAKRPLSFIAVACLAGMGIWAATAWTASLLLLLPAPVALVASAAVWTSAARLGLAAPKE